uniref:Integrase, catalytic region, zinc finger, CCHC-type, peptidase aspartic, catalytic n=1 Tax=Tanacetum cinerariifolium TaxID=118510 RepID=A0A6L2N7V0_TANCI|nr:integrase, catalytic region, zinc finger, CCHC-type, peptidase aspartic, catalytic [Tanacetum cinerariifolium]
MLMIDCLSIVKTDKVIHNVETDIVKLMVEIKRFVMSSDEFDKETRSSDSMQPKQADMSCVHALNELHLHEIYVFPNNSEYFLGLVTPFSSIAKDLHTADYTQLYDFLKYNQKEVDELKAERLSKIQDPLTFMANSNNPYAFPAPHQDQPSFNQNCMQQPMTNPKDIIDPTTTMNMKEVDELKAERLSKIQDPLTFMANSNNPYAFPAPHQDQPSFNQNCMQQPMPNPKDIIDPTTTMNMNLNGNGNLVAARAKGNAAGHNENQIRCYNCRGVDLDEIEEVNANCILMANLQQASTSGTQSDKAPVYDSDGLAEYTELLEPIPEQHQVPQNDNNVIFEVTSVEQGGKTVKQHPASFEETHLNKHLSKEKSNVSFLLEEKKRLKSDFKFRKDELPDKQIQLEKKLKELNNILVKTGQSIQTIHMLSPKTDSFYHTEQKMALGYQNPFYLKQAQKKQQSLYDEKVLLEKHDPPVVHDSEETLQHAQEISEELYFSNDSKMANVSKSISIPNEEFSDDTTPSVARKFLKEVKNTIVTLQRIVKHRMTVETHNWSSSAHQELYKIVKDENFPIDNQVDARVQNFEIQFLKEAAKFVGDFKSLAKEADESLAKHKELELEIERLLRAVVSQDIMSIVQKTSVVDTSNLQTELEHTLNPLSQKLENANVDLEFQALNYARENAHLKAKYKNLFDSISVSRTQTKTLIASLQNELQNTIYENDKLKAQLFNKVSDQKDKKRGTSKNTKFAKHSILGKPPMLDEIHALSKPVTSNSYPTPQESKVVKNDKVIAPGMVRINPFKTSREAKHVPNNVRASARTKPITVSQPSVIPKKDVIQICLWCVNSGCSKHMIGNLKLLINFVWKFLGTVRFGNDHVAAILGFVDLQCGNILITRVYFIEGLGHNLFSVGQFCDSDLEVAFRRNACFVRNLEGVDLLKGDRSTNLYTINLHEMASASPIRIMAQAFSIKSWLWHQRLSHLNFDTINDLARNNLVSGLPKFKYNKEHLCPSLERRNRTSVEAARTMLIFSCAPLFLWAEAIATACFTQNRSIIHRRFNKTPYELINGRKPNILFLHVFEALCYPKNDHEDIGKLGAKGDIGFFIGYSADSCAYRIFNRRTNKIMKTMNVSFDELSTMAFEQRSSKPELESMTSGHFSSRLDLTYAPSTITNPQPSEGELDLLFEAMYDDYIVGQPLANTRTVPATQEPQVRQTSTASTSIADTAPTPTNSSSHVTNIPITSQDVKELNPNAMSDGNTFVNPFVNPSTSAVESSSSQNVDPSNMHTFYQPYPHEV